MVVETKKKFHQRTKKFYYASDDDASDPENFSDEAEGQLPDLYEMQKDIPAEEMELPCEPSILRTTVFFQGVIRCLILLDLAFRS